MRSGKTLAVGAMFLLGIAITTFQQSTATADGPTPWNISKVTKLNRARGAEAGEPTAGPQKYLHIQVQFNVSPAEQKKHNFHVTDARGEEIGELWGWNDARSLVIFEGSWADLNGLYLDANGHREPLFQRARVARPVVATDPERPRTVQLDPRRPRTYVTPKVRTRVDVPGPNRVAYRGTTRVYSGPDVIHHGGARHVYRGGPDVIHHGGGGTKHVYDDGPDTVVHHGGGGTKHVYDDGAGGGEGGSGTGAGEGPGAGPGEGPGAGPGEGCEKCENCGGTGVCPKCEGKGCPECNGTGKCPECSGTGSCAAEKCEKCNGTKICPHCQGKGCEKCKNTGKCPYCCSPGEGAGPGMGSGPGGPGTGPGMGPGGPGMGPGGPGQEGPFRPRRPGRYGEGGPGGYGPVASTGIKGNAPVPEKIPAYVLYIPTGDETGPGKVYQVNEHGRVLGWVNTPYTPSGIALHRDNGLVLALPRDGGKIMRIDDTGKLSTLLEKDKDLVHPVDVAVGGDSDTVLVADNIGDVLAGTSTGGVKPKVYQRFEGQKWTAQDMSIAITNDKHVIFGTDGDKGIFRFSGDDHSAGAKPLLPNPGGVAADPKSLRWAATQPPNQIYLFEGEELVKKLRLPPGKSHYRNGLLSFSPSGNLVVSARDSEKSVGEPWFLQYRTRDEDEIGASEKIEGMNADEYTKAWDSQKTEIRSLFPWTRENMTDFVVGPRMFWDRNSPNTYKSTY